MEEQVLERDVGVSTVSLGDVKVDFLHRECPAWYFFGFSTNPSWQLVSAEVKMTSS